MITMRTTSYCTADVCDHDTVRKGFIRCEVNKGLCAYQTQDKSKARRESPHVTVQSGADVK